MQEALEYAKETQLKSLKYYVTFTNNNNNNQSSVVLESQIQSMKQEASKDNESNVKQDKEEAIVENASRSLNVTLTPLCVKIHTHTHTHTNTPWNEKVIMFLRFFLKTTKPA